jgi:methylated-DNA-[protein]-cysteine S-methyltransferase
MGVTFAIALQGAKISASAFSADQKTALDSILAKLPLNEPFEVCNAPSTRAKKALKTLKDLYDGKTPMSKPKLATTHLPSYTKKVLAATVAIPVGYVTTYSAIAKAVGGGPRAVGNAMACNQFPIVVPCHRVVKSDMSLGGYGAGGLGVKLEFLRREQRGYKLPKTIPVCCGELEVYPVEQVLAKYE